MLWIGRMRRKKMSDQYAEEKRWVFSFNFKEQSEDECLTEREKEFQITGLMIWKAFSPRVRLLSILGTQKCPRLSEESEKESRDETTRRGLEELYQRQCGRERECSCCVCILDRKGSRVFASRALVVVYMTVRPTSYSDCPIGFHELLLPPYRCYTSLKNV